MGHPDEHGQAGTKVNALIAGEVRAKGLGALKTNIVMPVDGGGFAGQSGALSGTSYRR